MRIFIAFEGSCEPFDISQGQTVRTIKRMIKDFFHVQLSDDKRTRRFLELSYAGAALLDSWSLPDIGISPCSTIRCQLKEEDKPVLHVFSAVTKETLPVMGTVFLLSTSVSRLKTLVSLQSGLPVSTFRLTTQSGLELYNCNRLDEYAIGVGATLRLDTWDGWTELLRGCFLGHSHTVQRYLSEEEPVMRFQQRVALDTDHPEIAKCPIHAAAESGQLHILKFFISSSILSLDCPDPKGCSPLQIAIQHGHKECVRYLVTKRWSVLSFPGMALPMGIYVQLKRWVCKAQRQASTCSQRHRVTPRARVGDTVLVDGFTVPEMTSKPWSRVTRARRGVQCHILPALTAGHVPGRPSRPPSRPASQNAPDQLPQMHPATVDGSGHRRGSRQEGQRRTQEVLSAESRDQNRNTWRSKVPLPAVSRDTNPRPRFIYASPNSSLILTSSLESFTKHSGRSSRENAIYCLALASAFTEKPWLHQLGMARRLAQRTVHKLL
ncbi:hypothetical protein AAFF_G00003930 [Aldrovandia affinis]|uniref:Ubiquitin-like domain-containing protein n=1 Tax=Aldrovandia affinis TaxID=143900 RepID=A0AAD7TDB5_9TELE|nr:hypothetical protein AAFF_G00003930 [Aldrovandia affinis]